MNICYDGTSWLSYILFLIPLPNLKSERGCIRRATCVHYLLCSVSCTILHLLILFREPTQGIGWDNYILSLTSSFVQTLKQKMKYRVCFELFCRVVSVKEQQMPSVGSSSYTIQILNKLKPRVFLYMISTAWQL